MSQKWTEKRLCKLCHKIFYARKHDISCGRGIYCSWACSRASRRNRVKRICQFCGKEFEVACGVIKKGNGKFCSKKCFFDSYKPKIKRCVHCGKIIQNRVTMCLKCRKSTMSGENGSNWRGGVTSVNASIRSSKKYADWRIKVFRRDKYICQDCYQLGGELHAHHIRSFSRFPKLRFKLSNGLTLCKECHNKYPKRWKEANNA